MRHVKMLATCLIAAFAIAAVAASGASALEWGKCENVGTGGNYAGPNCGKTEKAKPTGSGAYEYRKASEVEAKRVAAGKSPGVPFTGGSVGGGVLTTGALGCESGTYKYVRIPRSKCTEGGGEVFLSPTGVNIECTGETNTGETVGKAGVGNVHVTFTGCVAFGSFPCEDEGAPEGEVVVNTLKGKLGYLNKSKKEVGVVLEPVAKHGSFAHFECSEELIKTTVGVGNSKEGSFYVTSGCYGECPGTTTKEEAHGGYDQIISPITPVNTETGSFEQVFKVNEKHENVPNKFEGKHVSLLEDHFVLYEEGDPNKGSMWSPAGEEVTNVNTPEEEGMIKA